MKTLEMSLNFLTNNRDKTWLHLRRTIGSSAYLIVISTMLFWDFNLLMLFFSVDCQWSAWSWRGCSKSCGYGVQSGTRRIVRHARNGGRRCYGGTSTSRRCRIRTTCPTPGIIMYYCTIT